MDFLELLSAADSNKEEAQYEASIKRYSSVLPPPKKVPKSNVQSSGVKSFLERKRAEEEAKINEERKKKEQLLALRAKNTKSNKKAKIMASRTKDNDFSKIRLTEDEIEAKKKREEELIRQNLANKVERMKARIEMEEKEKMLPKKRKRKSKNGERIESHDDPSEGQHNEYCDSISDVRLDRDRSLSNKSNGVRRPPKPAPPALSFSDLLKVAEKKQYEPVPLAVKKKEDEKLMTKKERRLLQMELDRQRRKQERLKEMEQVENNRSSSLQTNLNKKDVSENSTDKSKKPYVIHVEKDMPKLGQQPKFKIPKSTKGSSSKNIPVKAKETSTTVNSNKIYNKPNSISEKSLKSIQEQKKVTKSNGETSSFHKDVEDRKKVMVSKKNEIKVNPVSVPGKRIAHIPVKRPAPVPAKSAVPAPAKPTAPVPPKPAAPTPSKPTSLVPAKPTLPAPKFDEDALTAAIEKRIRERIEKEMEEKLAAKFGLKLKNSSPPDKASANKKVSEAPKEIVKKELAAISSSNKKTPDKPMLSKKDMERKLAMHKRAMEQKLLARKLPEKKPFHTNPYLDPPRRLLEPQRLSKPPPKRRIESDDDDEEDDMSDFIDDGPSQNDEDYSKYIKEIFGYDRNRYVDDDDDDIMETSFAEQMKEEVKSAKLGYLEDLEEERKENERKKRKKLKK